MVVGLFSDQEMKTDGTEPATPSQKDDGIIPHERASCIPMFLPTGKGPPQMQTWKRNYHLNAEFSAPDLLKRTVLAERVRESAHWPGLPENVCHRFSVKISIVQLTVEKTSICRWPSCHSAWKSSTCPSLMNSFNRIERRETLSRRLTVPPTSPRHPVTLPSPARQTYHRVVSLLNEKLSS